MDSEYWLALAVYDEFRGIPLRKIIAEGYLPLSELGRTQQAQLIRLGSLFFQGRCWRQLVGITDGPSLARVSEAGKQELAIYQHWKGRIGDAVVRFLDDDHDLSPIARDAAKERLSSMGFLDGDYCI